MKPEKVWPSIRKEIQTTHQPGSVGEQVAMIKAAQIFLAVFQVCPEELQVKLAKSFNTDQELTTALFNQSHLKAIGVLQ